jgi:hypothetical protein
MVAKKKEGTMARLVSLCMSAGTLLVSLAGCAHGPPKCDYEQPVSTCSASVDPSGAALVLRAVRCAQVEIRSDDHTRVIRTDDGESSIASADSNVEVLACRTYKDIRAQ